jgi:CDP-diacylglycerol---glycerol-3-phosphate 3-phosphatidyltransferase
MIHRARRRIFISSLYIGSAERELVCHIFRCSQNSLINTQIDTLHASLENNSSLNLYLTLDLNRSTRPGPSSTVEYVLPLLREFPDRVHISVFRSPKLRGLFAKLVPPRFNEGWGTWHAKIYGADDDVMISGYVGVASK